MPLAAAAGLASFPTLSQAQAGPWESPGRTLAVLGCSRSALWATQAVPVSFTLAPGPAVEKLLDEVLGLFLHYRFGVGEREGQAPPCRTPQVPPRLAVQALTTPSRRGRLS